MDPDIERVLGELSDILGRVRPGAVEAVSHQIQQASNVFVHGIGRTGLIGRAFAMRLMHLGLRAHVVGQATAPAIGPGDLLVACSASGTTEAVVAAARKARAAGARVLAITGSQHSPLGQAADARAVVPAQATGQQQFGGSAFEQALLVLLDSVVLDLARELGVSHAQMHRRHANLP